MVTTIVISPSVWVAYLPAAIFLLVRRLVYLALALELSGNVCAAHAPQREKSAEPGRSNYYAILAGAGLGGPQPIRPLATARTSRSAAKLYTRVIDKPIHIWHSHFLNKYILL